MNRALIIDRFEGIGRRQNLYLVERLRAIQALPVMNGPEFIIELKTVIVFLKEVVPSAKGAHDRVHTYPPISALRSAMPQGMKIASTAPLPARYG
jgi:hypothetical protein